MSTDQLRWLESLGGPLLLVEAGHAGAWQGVDPPHPWRNVKATFRSDPTGAATDYDRACDVGDWLGLIDVGDGHGLVLGDEPAPTAWLPSADGGYLIRWLAAESDGAVLAAWRQAQTLGIWTPGARIVVELGPLLLFDAATPGDDAEASCLRLDLAPGAYIVSTVEWKTADTQLTLHHLSRETGTSAA